MNTQSKFQIRAALTAATLAVAAFAATPTVMAQLPLAQVDVPFAFENGSTHLPAGTYTVSMLNERVMDIRGNTGSTFSMVQPEDRLDPAQNGRLVFHRYGDRYILREIWTAGSRRHLECPKTKLEKELQLASDRSRTPGVEIASIDVLR